MPPQARTPCEPGTGERFDDGSGKRAATIARERGTSPRTISNQLASAYRKLGVTSRREVLALLA